MITEATHGLSAQTLEVIKDIFRKNSPAGVNLVVYIFGLRAKGTHSKYSDVDLFIECEALPKDALFKIAENLEESSLPYKFDLVDAVKLAPEYKHSVNAYKTFLFAL